MDLGGESPTGWGFPLWNRQGSSTTHGMRSGGSGNIFRQPREVSGLGEGTRGPIVFVALVAGDDDDGAVVFVRAQRLEHVGGA